MFYVLYLEQRRTHIKKVSNYNFSLWWWWGSIFFLYTVLVVENKRGIVRPLLSLEIYLLHICKLHIFVIWWSFIIWLWTEKNTTYKNKSNAFSPFIEFYILEQPTKDDDLHINIHLYTYMSVYVCIFLCFFVMITLSILVYTQLQIGNIYGWFFM